MSHREAPSAQSKSMEKVAKAGCLRGPREPRPLRLASPGGRGSGAQAGGSGGSGGVRGSKGGESRLGGVSGDGGVSRGSKGGEQVGGVGGVSGGGAVSRESLGGRRWGVGSEWVGGAQGTVGSFPESISASRYPSKLAPEGGQPTLARVACPGRCVKQGPPGGAWSPWTHHSAPGSPQSGE